MYTVYYTCGLINFAFCISSVQIAISELITRAHHTKQCARSLYIFIHDQLICLAVKRSYLYKREMWWNCTNRFGSIFLFFALRARKWRELFNLDIFKEVEWFLYYLFWNSCHYHSCGVVLLVSIGWNGPASMCCQIKYIFRIVFIYIDILTVYSKWCTWSVIIVTHFECYANVLSPNAGFRLILVAAVDVVVAVHVLSCLIGAIGGGDAAAGSLESS